MINWLRGSHIRYVEGYSYSRTLGVRGSLVRQEWPLWQWLLYAWFDGVVHRALKTPLRRLLYPIVWSAWCERLEFAWSRVPTTLVARPEIDRLRPAVAARAQRAQDHWLKRHGRPSTEALDGISSSPSVGA